MAVVVVHRESESGGLFRAMRVRLGAEILAVKANSTARREVAAGDYEIRASMDWVRSPTLHVSLAEGDELHLSTSLKISPIDMFVNTSQGIRLDIDRAATLRAGTPAEVVDQARITTERVRFRSRLPLALTLVAFVVVLVLVQMAVARLF